jgi:chromosome partitioning protein
MGHIITFAQQKGGAGKTTALAPLAVAWSQAGRSVALIDLDPQRTLTRWAELRDDPELDLIDSKDYRAGLDIKTAARSHDLVLADCPGAASNLLENALRESDLVIAPCQPSVMDVWATQSVLDTARKLKTDTRILLNRVPARMGAMDEVMAALGDARAHLLDARLGNRVAFSKSVLSGRTAQELSKSSLAAAEVTALRDEIDAILAQA